MADYNLSHTAEEVDELLTKAKSAVLHTPQELNEEQKAQARENIGAVAEGEIDSGLIESLDDAVFETVPFENVNKLDPNSVSQETYFGNTRYVSGVIHCNVGDTIRVYRKNNAPGGIVCATGITFGVVLVGSTGEKPKELSKYGEYVVVNDDSLPDIIGVKVIIRALEPTHSEYTNGNPEEYMITVELIPPVVEGTVYYTFHPWIEGNQTKKNRIERLENRVDVIENSNIMSDKKILVIGDSISADYYGNYDKWVTKLIDQGFFSSDNVTNDSIHATGFSVTAGETIDESQLFINRLKAVENPEDYDLVVIFGGINDFIKCQTTEIEFSVFTEAVDDFFEYLTDTFINARVCVFSPLRISYNSTNLNQHTQQDYMNYIKDVAKSYCLPVLNLSEESGFYPWKQNFKNRWTFTGWAGGDGTSGDGVHPSEEWIEVRLVPMIKSFLKSLI